ncbi:MAG: cystathionine gamma-synthase [Gammaproteobacteria bacterium]|nr:cystathionine gamma-synthase [Gammaproteobacteria bacterium]
MPHRASSRTRAVRAGIASETQYGAVVPPLHLSSNFTFADLGEPRAYDYTRSANPTRDQLGQALAELEGGAGAVITGSGMSAIHLVTRLLNPGDLLIAPHDCYGGTNRLFKALAEKGCIHVRFIDQTDARALRQSLQEGPALLWVETPSNPLLRIVDIEAAARLCREHQTLLAVDNTFLSPGWQQPIALGADLVVHSTTKYLNGHSDVVGGAAISKDESLAEQLSWWGNCLGLTGAPFDSYLTLRGVRTLHARLRLHQENAQAVVDALLQHDAVKKVHYPGLKDHPGHEIAKKQQSSFGAMASFRIEGGLEGVKTFIGSLNHFSLAESLGGVESLVAHPATMTHKSMTAEAKARAGIDDDLIRLSIGIEDTDDLVADLNRALDTTLAVRKARAMTVAA